MEFDIAHTPEQYAIAAKLFRQYADWLAIDLCFQGFDNELLNLPAMYGPPSGAIILCRDNNEWIACVGIRRISADMAELKRMYVLPAWQKKGIGRELLNRALQLAAEMGYTGMQLDTLDHMTAAINLYRYAGFYDVPPYYHNPEPGAVYMEKKF